MKTYTEEFKKTIVELYENGNRNKSELAREYGTSEGNVRAWIKKYGTQNGVRIDIWTHFMRGCIIDYVH